MAAHLHRRMTGIDLTGDRMGLVIGTLKTEPARERPDLLAGPVTGALAAWPEPDVLVAPIDPELADTAAFCEAYDVGLDVSANCVVVAGKREGEVRYAACMVLATTRADVNGVVRRHLDVRKASFAPMDTAVAMTGMEYGGITPIGLPADWPILIDARVAQTPYVIIGSGVRHSKIALPGAALTRLPGAVVIENLARAIDG
jgi:prolyl-tRNA editing enzyme YbaK/EbsC (Cys-tRNA(Pro) deacylase)